GRGIRVPRRLAQGPHPLDQVERVPALVADEGLAEQLDHQVDVPAERLPGDLLLLHLTGARHRPPAYGAGTPDGPSAVRPATLAQGSRSGPEQGSCEGQERVGDGERPPRAERGIVAHLEAVHRLSAAMVAATTVELIYDAALD